jgi:hypothetical protein
MAHPYHMHREHQVSHRRVAPHLSGEPAGAKRHATGQAFSAVTSKTAAQSHDDGIGGVKGNKRYACGGKVKDDGYARGGKVKHKGHQTNIAIVMPHHPAVAPAPAGLPPGPAGGPPMGGPGLPPGGPPGMPPGMPPGGPPGMPMRARGGKIDGEATKGNIKEWAARASKNSYFRGGAATGVGREEKAEHVKRRK